MQGYTPEKIQLSFMRFTAQQMKFRLQKEDPGLLATFKVVAKDREYQFWKRNSLSVDLFTTKVFEQKLAYIHYNPVKAGLCQLPEEYHYSSARYYEFGIDDFGLFK